LVGVVDMIRRARELELHNRTDVEKMLEPLREATRSSDYLKAVQITEGLVPEIALLDNAQLLEALNAVERAIKDVPPEYKIGAYQTIARISGALYERTHEEDHLWNRLWARTHEALGNVAAGNEALAQRILDEMVANEDLYVTDDLQQRLAYAKLTLADIIAKEDPQRAVQLRTWVLEKYRANREDTWVWYGAAALYDLARERPVDEQQSAFEELLEEFTNSGPDAELRLALSANILLRAALEVDLDRALRYARQLVALPATTLDADFSSDQYELLEKLRMSLVRAARDADAQEVLRLQKVLVETRPLVPVLLEARLELTLAQEDRKRGRNQEAKRRLSKVIEEYGKSDSVRGDDIFPRCQSELLELFAISGQD
jgi:hypothetical protein